MAQRENHRPMFVKPVCLVKLVKPVCHVSRVNMHVEGPQGKDRSSEGFLVFPLCVEGREGRGGAPGG